MFWPDTQTGVDIQPARSAVQSAVRKYFTEGGVGVPPTVPGGDWFNQITNEVLAVLADAGISPSKVDDTQLLAAIKQVSNSTSAYEALRRSYADAGYTLIGSFDVGCTVTEAKQVILLKSTGICYEWTGEIPAEGYVVDAGTNPISVSGFNSRSADLLRLQLAASNGASMSLSQLATTYGVSYSNGSIWADGASMDVGKWAYYGDQIWTPNADSTVCGPVPDYADFHTLAIGEYSISNFGAVASGAGDYGANMANALSVAYSEGLGNILVPPGTWRAATEITVIGNSGLIGSIKTSSIILLEGDTDYGINVAGDGLGGSVTDGITIGNLNIWGGKDVALIRIHGTGLFHLHDIVAQNNTEASVVRFTESQDGNFDKFDFLQCGGSYPASPIDGAVVYYGPGCNNIYTRYGRIEAPRNTAIYVDGANSIIFDGGKVDGSLGGASLTDNPFVIVDDGDVSFSDFHITGFQAIPMRILGYGKICFKGAIGNGLSEACFDTESLEHAIGLDVGGYLPGTLFSPAICIDADVSMRSENTLANIIDSVFKIVSPYPLAKPNTGNDGRVTISGAFDTGLGYYQAAITEWDGSAFSTPTTNDRYVGLYLCNMATGAVLAKISAQSEGLVQFYLIGSVPDGVVHAKFVVDDYIDLRGIVRVKDRLNPKPNIFLPYATVQVTAASYADGMTTLELSASQTNDEMIGLFIKLDSKYFYIASNSGSQLNLIGDATSDYSLSTDYSVTYGKLTDKLTVLYA